MLPELAQRAHARLAADYGAKWRAPYGEGKARMVDTIRRFFDIAPDRAASLIETLERQKRIEFVPTSAALERASRQTCGAESPRLGPTTQVRTKQAAAVGVQERQTTGQWVIVRTGS